MCDICIFAWQKMPFESYGRPHLAQCQSHCSHGSVSEGQVQVCATVPVEHAVGREQQLSAVGFRSPAHDAKLTELFDILASSFPPESVRYFGKSACNSFMAR
jgi:hypothetical protein